jgi:hypothetical protein
MRTSPLIFITAAALAAGCGATHQHSMAPASDPAGSPTAARVLHLKPGHYTFRLGRDAHVGERIRCVTRGGGPAGGGSIEPRGHGVGSSTGFEATTFRNGVVRVVCPANPGNA